jgi:hypothetical protein
MRAGRLDRGSLVPLMSLIESIRHRPKSLHNDQQAYHCLNLMPLAAATRFGSCPDPRAIGAGGTGEVYRAKDTDWPARERGERHIRKAGSLKDLTPRKALLDRVEIRETIQSWRRLAVELANRNFIDASHFKQECLIAALAESAGSKS